MKILTLISWIVICVLISFIVELRTKVSDLDKARSINEAYLERLKDDCADCRESWVKSFSRQKEKIGDLTVDIRCPDERFEVSLIDQLEAIKSHLMIQVVKEPSTPEKIVARKLVNGVTAQ
jgi:hypothetical protein